MNTYWIAFRMFMLSTLAPYYLQQGDGSWFDSIVNLAKQALQALGDALQSLGGYLDKIALILVALGLMGLIIGLFMPGIVGGGGIRYVIMAGVIMVVAGLVTEFGKIITSLMGEETVPLILEALKAIL